MYEIIIIQTNIVPINFNNKLISRLNTLLKINPIKTTETNDIRKDKKRLVCLIFVKLTEI